jgi:hypothetical protein
MPVPKDRNSAGKGSVGLYLVGIVCAAVGIYLATVTRINLLTGQTSSPYLGIGIRRDRSRRRFGYAANGEAESEEVICGAEGGS